MARNTGFTLLELLVALAIFGVAALAALTMTNQTLSQQQRLEDRTLALWLAENELAELRLTNPWPNKGMRNETRTFGDRQWQVVTTIHQTANGSLRRVTVAVARSYVPSPGVSLTGYTGEH